MEESTLCVYGDISKKKFDKLTNSGYTVKEGKRQSFISIKGTGIPFEEIPKIEKLLQRKVFLADKSKVKLCNTYGEPRTVEGFKKAKFKKYLIRYLMRLMLGSRGWGTRALIKDFTLTKNLREAISGAVEEKKPGTDVDNMTIYELTNLLGSRIQELFLMQDFGYNSPVTSFHPHFLDLSMTIWPRYYAKRLDR